MYQKARTATGACGKKITVGTRVQLQIFGAEGVADSWGPTVEVRSVHKQGYDGTILSTVPAPNPEYPHHFSGRAKYFRVVGR